MLTKNIKSSATIRVGEIVIELRRLEKSQAQVRISAPRELDIVVEEMQTQQDVARALQSMVKGQR